MVLDDGGYVELDAEQRARIAKLNLPSSPRGPGDRSLLAWSAGPDALAALCAGG